MKGMFLRAWRYRHFILSSIRTEFRARFIRSRLGGLWMIIHPLAQVAIYYANAGRNDGRQAPSRVGVEAEHQVALTLRHENLCAVDNSVNISKATRAYMDCGYLFLVPMLTTLEGPTSLPEDAGSRISPREGPLLFEI